MWNTFHLRYCYWFLISLQRNMRSKRLKLFLSFLIDEDLNIQGQFSSFVLEPKTQNSCNIPIWTILSLISILGTDSTKTFSNYLLNTCRDISLAKHVYPHTLQSPISIAICRFYLCTYIEVICFYGHTLCPPPHTVDPFLCQYFMSHNIHNEASIWLPYTLCQCTYIVVIHFYGYHIHDYINLYINCRHPFLCLMPTHIQSKEKHQCFTSK